MSDRPEAAGRPLFRDPASGVAVVIAAVIIVAAAAMVRVAAADDDSAEFLYGVRAGVEEGGVEAFTCAAGKAPNLLLDYMSFGKPFEGYQVRNATARGAFAYVTWEPMQVPDGGSVPEFPLARVAEGAYDDYVRTWAAAARDTGAQILLRFGHEMNGSWYPWATGKAGNTPADYVAAWKHLRAVFDDVGADNIAWAWTPNVVGENAEPFESYFPGDAHVDWVGLDGYNWGAVNGNRWSSPQELFDNDLDRLRKLTNRPILVGEVGSAELGGDKGQWISDFFDWMEQRPEVRGFAWFNRNKEADWRIQSSSEAQQEFAEGISDSRYPSALPVIRPDC